MRHNVIWILASAILLTASAVPARANLITDPGFESCTNPATTPPGWSVSSAHTSCGESPNYTGNGDAISGAAESALSQTITTIAGDNYDFSFWLAGESRLPIFLHRVLR